MLAIQSCNSGSESGHSEHEETDLVESGTYTGSVDEVEAEKTEIYVKTDDGKTLELYFTDNTMLMEDDAKAEFSALEKGDRVEVEVVKKGKRLDPVKVTILN
jgi:Cu/Ag efflux protein CusF